MIDNRSTGARSVKPRKPVTNANRPILAVIDDAACDESGTTYTTDDAITALRKLPPHIVVTGNESAAFLRRVIDRYGDNPNFNARVAPVEREIFTGKDTGRRLVMSLTSVAYFGWEKEKTGRGNTVRNRYHLLIDPLTFSNNWLKDRTLSAYIQWMQDVRDFCIAQGWNLRPTQGSVARQALQDSRFYPEARRKVPAATNNRVRAHLPGNHYQLGEDVSLHREYEAEYLDQSRCHHWHAMTARLPDANHLNGYGHFRDPDCKRPYKRTPERVAQFLDGFMGLVYGHIRWPYGRRVNRTQFVPKFLEPYRSGNPPTDPIYFLTEDLPLFESLGIKVTSIVAAWGSKKQDTGLTKYAAWALGELKDDAPIWKKTLLLSTYGSLATTSRKHTVGFHRSKGGKRQTLTTKHGTRLDMVLHQSKKELEPVTNNVLHRALIESSNRTETLLFATTLNELGYRVLCIYVDAVMVESDEDLSLPLFKPWRVDEHLTHLRFLSETQFTSAELTKLPGVTGRELREKVSRGTVRGSTGGRKPQLGTRTDMQLRAYEAWLSYREKAQPKPSALDSFSPEERWQVLTEARSRPAEQPNGCT